MAVRPVERELAPQCISDTELRGGAGTATPLRTLQNWITTVTWGTSEQLSYGETTSSSREPGPPAWVQPTKEAFEDLCELAPNWDSYGALAPNPLHIDAAWRILLDIMQRSTPPPAVVPTNDGHIQLEWHTCGIDLEVETLSTHKYLVSFEDANTGEEWEGEISSDLTRLVEWIARLS